MLLAKLDAPPGDGKTREKKGTLKGFLGRIGPKDRESSTAPVSIATTKIVGQTSKCCPICKAERIRDFYRGVPLSRVDYGSLKRIEKDKKEQFPFHHSRATPEISEKKWGSLGVLKWLIWPFVINPNSSFFFCYEKATCESCDRTDRVLENCYYRQFSPIRRITFIPMDMATLTLRWSKKVLYWLKEKFFHNR